MIPFRAGARPGCEARSPGQCMDYADEECVPRGASLIESALEEGREWPLATFQGLLART